MTSRARHTSLESLAISEKAGIAMMMSARFNVVF